MTEARAEANLETVSARRDDDPPAPARALGAEPGPRWIAAIAWLFARAPWSSLSAIGRALAWLAGSVLRIRRAQVEAALLATGVASDARGASHLARDVYGSLGTGLSELLWLAGRRPAALDDLYSVAPGSAEALAGALARGRGAIVVTAHTGNWDLAACATARHLASTGKGPLHVVTKRLHWRALDRTWQRLRAERGVALVDARGALGAARAALARGEVVAMLVDQAPERARGVATLPFLGKPALHDLAPAVLASRTGAPLVTALSHRTPEGRHVLEVVRVVDAPAASRTAQIAATTAVAAAVEAHVRRHPAQWLWLHRRWKGVASPA